MDVLAADVFVGALLVAADVPVTAEPPTEINTYISSPKNCPEAVDIRQLLRSIPVLFVGAVMSME